MKIINLIEKMDKIHKLDEVIDSHEYWSEEWHNAMQLSGQITFDLIEEIESYGRAYLLPLLILHAYFYMSKLLTSPYFEVVLTIVFILILVLLSTM